MNKIHLNMAIFVICLACSSVYGQKREISKEMFNDSYKKAGENTGKLSHRIISEGYVYRDEESQIRSVEKGISEIASPNRSRFSIEHKNNELNTISYFELIKIDGVEYKRRNNGEWKKENTVINPNPTNSKSSRSEAKYYLTENARLNNQTADLFELEVEYKHQTTNPVNRQMSESTTCRKEKRWISKDGLLLKLEMVDENTNPRKINSRRIWVYEYDPTIKIEAPIK